LNDSGLPETLGTIEWEIVAGHRRKTLHHGRRVLARRDVEVISHAIESEKPRPWTPAAALYNFLNHYRKQIYLEDGFLFSLVSKPAGERTDIVGFGFVAERTSTHSFSWEWFNVDGDDRAKKIQEGGELGIRIERGPLGWEIAHTELLTDISLRLMPRQEQGCLASLIFPRPWKPLWRIRILKGSHVTWPFAERGG
jgi:hypothetical protein